MSRETVIEILQKLPHGCYVHRLDKFVNGTVSLTKRKTVKLTIELDIESLGSPHEDVHAVLSPFANDVVPLLLFVEPSEFLSEKDHAISKDTGNQP